MAEVHFIVDIETEETLMPFYDMWAEIDKVIDKKLKEMLPKQTEYKIKRTYTNDVYMVAGTLITLGDSPETAFVEARKIVKEGRE